MAAAKTKKPSKDEQEEILVEENLVTKEASDEPLIIMKEAKPRRITCHKYLAVRNTKPHHFPPMLQFAEQQGARGTKTLEEWDAVFSKY